MKQVTTNLYSFNELNAQAQAVAIEKFIERSDIHIHNDEIKASIKAFCELFNASYDHSVGLWGHSYLTFESKLDDEILELKGKRLIAWVTNNTKLMDFEPKVYKVGDKVRKSKILSNGVALAENCMFTGVCWDIDLTKSFNEAVLSGKTLDECLDEASSVMLKTWIKQMEYYESEEYAKECLEENDDCIYTETGREF